MDGTIGVIALDAADYALATDWDCENILLDTHSQIETFTYGTETPSTLEVWPSVATGLHPEDHGIVNENETAQSWESPVLRLGSKVTQYLPNSVRTTLGQPFHQTGHQKKFQQTDEPHVFEDGHVFSWPGITPASNLADAWNLMFRSNEADMQRAEFEGELFKLFGSEMAWLTRMADTNVPIVGVHSHILDIAGHAYMTREDRLRSVYERVDETLGWVRENVDHLVILSDHGMQVSWIDDTTGKHSMRSLFGTTAEGPLPDSVFDVKDWLEARKRSGTAKDDEADFDTTTEQLEALGYR